MLKMTPAIAGLTAMLFAAFVQERTAADVYQPRRFNNPLSERVLYSFGVNSRDGVNPRSALIGDPSKALYGTTVYGGTFGQGTVFRLTPSGTGFREKILYRFLGGQDGANPSGSLIADGMGALYGTTPVGGAKNAGTVFRLSPTANGYIETLLYTFQGGIDGANPTASLIADDTGALFGTAFAGGNLGQGTVFKLKPTAGGYRFSVIHVFHGSVDGAEPEAALLAGTGGELFGTTRIGGANSDGTAFELTPADGKYSLTVLHSFTGGSDGKWPIAELVTDSAGSLYGTTAGFQGHDHGTVFKLTPNEKGYTYSVLHYFTHLGDGVGPGGAVLEDSSGDLFGTTGGGGAAQEGAVFKLTPSGNNYNETIVYSFQRGSDGNQPLASLIADSFGAVYSTTYGGGDFGAGAIFKLIP